MTHAMAAPTLVTHVSDTARWVAVYRALESQRPDALFRDPYAERLAGDRGREILERMPRTMRRMSWPMVIRTKLIDELLLEAIASGADRVLNLAAGLDTRPYRLVSLPPALRWIEADLPGILDEKERLLAREAPRCELTRERVDLAAPEARRAFLDRALDGAAHAIVVTEGLLLYLDEDAVRSLASDLAARPAIRSWVTDPLSPRILRMMQKQTDGLMSPDARMRFAPARGVAFFEDLGWRAAVIRPMLPEAARMRRLPLILRPLALLPSGDPRNLGNRPWSAVVRLDRAGA
jgi:methyltransferase (TIGR00027 family)